MIRPKLLRVVLAWWMPVLFGAPTVSCATHAAKPRLAESPAAKDDSALCRALSGHFVGLPRERPSAAAPPLLAGRLWLRDCHVETEKGTVRLALGGPAWYWLDRKEGGFRIRQRVSLDVEARLAGEFSLESERGIAAIHFRPTEEPTVSVRVTNRVDVEPQTFWAAILDTLPFAIVSAKARGRINTEVASQFEQRLDDGATLTFDLRRGESEMALGRLAAGDEPRHPFEDGKPSLANERQLLYPGGVHVIGPFEPAADMPLDVVVEEGPGFSYQAACARDVEESFGLDPVVPHLSPSAARLSGRMQGSGTHQTSLTLKGCSWYLLTMSSSESPSIVALRLRPGFDLDVM